MEIHKFERIKTILNGYVFWRIEGSVVKIKMVGPNKRIKQLLREYEKG